MHTPDQFTNFASSTIAGGAGGIGTSLGSGDTTLVLNTSDGAKFPSTAPFMVLLGAVSGSHELVQCTARVSDSLTIVRAREGTSAATWIVGTVVTQVATAGNMANLWTAINSNGVFNVKDYGAAGDGSTDDTTAIANAMSAASGGGTAYFPAGTYITGNQTLLSHVYLRGQGQGVTIIKLKNATNDNLFSADTASILLTGTAGSATSTCIYDFGLMDMTLDGNYGGQSSGTSYPLCFYGFGYLLQNLDCRNGYSGGILCDYNGAFPNSGGWVAADESLTNNERFESTWINVRSYQNLGTTTAIGIEMGGPHDSRWTNVLSYNNNSHSIHIGPHCGGLQATGCHAWASGHSDTHSCSWLQEGSLYANGCEAEGSPYAQLVLLANGCAWIGGSVFAGGAVGLGIQIGQTAGGTPYTNSTFQSAGLTTVAACSSYVVETILQNITHASGSIWLADDAGGVILCRCLAASGTNTIYTGTQSSKTTLVLNNQGYNDTRQQIYFYGGQGANGGAVVAYSHSSTAPDPGNNGTISTVYTNTRVTPAGNETGLILTAGTQGGQEVTVINESAFTLTFAASGTSHVADGTSDVIPANAARTYVWSAGTSLWYRLA